MSEETTEPIFEPAVFAVEQYQEENALRRRMFFGVTGAVLCIALGAGGVFAALYYSGQLRGPSQPVAMLPVAPHKEETPNIATYKPDVTPPVQQTTPKDPAKPTDLKPAPANTSPKPPSNVPPMDPFNGGPVPKDWQKGQIGPPEKGSVSIKPEGTADTNPDKPETSPASAAVLITARAGGGDPEGDAESIVQALRGAGASVRTANHFGSSGGVTGVQVVASLSVESLASAKSRLGAAGVSVGDDWTGAVEARSSRVSSILSSRISVLRKAKSDLLVKYLDDAPEVVQIDEEIEKLNQCLGMARSAGKSTKIAIIVIGVGGL